MANTFKYMYSHPVANKLPGSNTNFHFRTVTRYEVDANGKPTGKSTSQLYYTPSPGGRTTGGDTWTSGNENGENFDSAGYALAAESTDGGATWTPKQYTQEDANVISAIGNDRVGQNVLGATALQSLSTPGGRFYETAQNSIINTAVRTQPNLAAAVSKKLKNSATDTSQTPPASGDTDSSDSSSTPIDISTSPLVSRNIPASDNTRKSFGNHVYPLDLGKTKQDVIKFTMLEYVPKDFNQSGQFGFSNRDKPEDRNSIGTVILPIPGGIQDNNSVSWAGQNMNALEAGLANVALNTIERGVEGAVDASNQILDALKGGGGEAKTAIANAFAGAATGTGGQLLARTTGAVINPNLELLFSGPALRTFSFSFKMNAREAAESREIVRIIRFFKQGSAAQRSTSNLFLKSPHTFAVQYLHRGPEGSDNPFMGRIKECALQSIGVNYTPENNYATFKDGAMVSYQVTLNFSELEPVFNDDYSQLDGDADTLIGF